MSPPSPGRSPPSGTVSLPIESAPLGVKIVCVLGVIASFVTFFVSLELMTAGEPFAALGVLFILLTIGYLIVLYGLWTLRPWSWRWGLIAFAVNAILSLVQGNLVGFVVAVAIALYLTTKREHYRDDAVRSTGF